MSPTTMNLAWLRSEIEGGLKNEAERLHHAWLNRQMYEGNFRLFPTREENMYHERWDMRRTSRIMRRVIHVLTSSLYKKPPARTLGSGPEATAWLDRCYKRSAMQALWPEADRAALVNDYCAFRFAGNDDPATVVDVELFTRDQLVAWTRPGKPREVGAVATIEREDAGRTLTLWTDREILTYTTPKVAGDSTSGGTAWKFRSQSENPYGVIPFAFVHADFPTIDFETPGIGEFLRQVNDAVNFTLDNLGDAVRYLAFPIGVAEGVDPNWPAPAKLKPGQWLKLPGWVGMAGEEAMATPTLRFVGPDLGFVEVSYLDLNQYLDRALEDIGVPPGTIRLDDAASSGVQVMVEQGPLLLWAEARRQPFADYEAAAARTAAVVASGHLRSQGHPVPPWLDEAARAQDLALKWQPLYVLLPGVERDRSDDYVVARGYASKVDVLMAREDLTEEQAIAKLARVARLNAQLKAMGVDPGVTPPEEAATDGAGPGTVAEAAPLDQPRAEPLSGE